VHAAIWKFSGDPDDLLARYDAMMGEIGAANMRLHVCLRAEDGIVMLDTCPSEQAFEAFASSDAFRELRERHGLPEPAQVDATPCTWRTPAGRPSTARPRRRCARRSRASARRSVATVHRSALVKVGRVSPRRGARRPA
jgi:hypothetical protein